MANATIVNEKLDALLRREAALKTAIAKEKARQERRKAKDDARLFSVVGEALVRAAESPDFKLMLKQVVQSAELRDTDRSFLRGKEWL